MGPHRNPNRSRFIGFIFCATIALLFASGCVAPRSPLSTAEAEKIQTLLELKAHARFENAAYFKPRAGSASGAIETLAPLIVQQLPERAAPEEVHRTQFGAVYEGLDGNLSVDATQPTLYASYEPTDRARPSARIIFVWAYPALAADGHGIAFSGIEMTLSDDGYPVIYRALGGVGDRTIVFVDSEIESAAVEQFGPPVAGRRYSVERPVSEAADVFVARLLSRGPIPMGPFVYVDFPAFNAVSVLCRCMASQVDRFDVERWYDLRDLAELVDLGLVLEGSRLRAADSRRGSHLLHRTEPGSLTTRLRWPAAASGQP